MSKKIVILILLIVIVIAVPLTVYGYTNYNFNKLYNSGVHQLNNENFEEAINAFNGSLKYKPKKKELIENKVNLAKELKDSKAVFDSAIALANEKNYLEAIDAFKTVKNTDVKRYSDSQNKIKECSDNYIKENLDNAKDEATNKNYDKAIAYLDTILKFDNSNKDAQDLKDEYNNIIQQIAEDAKKAEEDKIATEKANLVAQNTVETTGSTNVEFTDSTTVETTGSTNDSSEGDIVKSNNDLSITLNGGADPNLGRIMSLRFAGVNPQPFGIAFDVVQMGFGYDINYDITFYLVGRTVKYSGKTSSEFVQLTANGSEVPKGENIKIVIDFNVNGKTYTTTGYRVLNNLY